MNEKSIGSSSADGFLVLLLPVAFVIVFIFAAWPLLLGVFLLSIGFKVWQRYRWQKWSQQVNPIFHQLIRANQGRVAALDLAMKGNFSAAAARRYLDYKAEEFGAQKQNYEELGNIYYFITSSTLGSIFDTSEPASIEPQETYNNEPQTLKIAAVATIAAPEVAGASREAGSDVAIVDHEVAEPGDDSHIHPPAIVTEPQIIPEIEAQQSQITLPESLIQSELAKRLNVYSSTVYKRRNDPDFSEWSRNRDPEGIAWKFSAKTKDFKPVAE